MCAVGLWSMEIVLASMTDLSVIAKESTAKTSSRVPRCCARLKTSHISWSVSVTVS